MKKRPQDLQLEYLAIKDLIPYARNAKLHSAEQVSAIAASIREFGFNNPVLVDANNGIIAGHGRVLAAHKLKMDAVPCIRLGHLTDTQRRAYIIADNRLAEIGGGWDVETLKLEIEELKLDDFAIDLTGFDDAALSALDFAGDGGGDSDSAGDPDEKANTVLVIGHIRIPLDRVRYMDWLESIRQAVGFDDPSIEKEILRRLQL